MSRKVTEKQTPDKTATKKTARRKKNTGVVVHQSKDVAVVKKDMVWSNASDIMASNREDLKTQVAANMMQLATRVFKLPPQGITILANQPYINKVGWKMKMREYHKDTYRIRTEWHHLATPNEKWAVCEAVIEIKDQKAGTWEEVSRAIGEAAPANIKLAAVQNTLNMMAETRAKNRAMSDFIGARAIEDAVKEITKNKDITEDQANVLTESARTTAEEMNAKETKTVNSERAFSFIEKLKIELHKRGAQNARQAIEMVNQVIDAQLSTFDEVDENIAKITLVELSKKK